VLFGNLANKINHQLFVLWKIFDVMAIENTGQFRGVYHVLGGKIFPLME
jgi:recombination protein RecR